MKQIRTPHRVPDCSYRLPNAHTCAQEFCTCLWDTDRGKDMSINNSFKWIAITRVSLNYKSAPCRNVIIGVDFPISTRLNVKCLSVNYYSINITIHFNHEFSPLEGKKWQPFAQNGPCVNDILMVYKKANASKCFYKKLTELGLSGMPI